MIPYILTDLSLTVFMNGKALTMQNSSQSFEAAKTLLSEERFDELEALFDTAKAVVSFAGGNIEVVNGQIHYLGEPIDNYVVDRILKFMDEGLPYKPLLRFLDKLMNNPSRRAVQELYTFLEHKNMPLTPEGNFLAYKSVRQDWKDHHTGRFSNTVGSVLKMTRNSVCDDANIGCSGGFHAGSLDYAKSFGGHGSRLLVVEIDPSNVVSVPLDCDCQKLRTSEYKVVAEFVRPLNEQLNDDYCDEDCDEDCDDEYDLQLSDDRRVVVSDVTRAKLRAKALMQKRVGGKFVK